MPPKAPDLILTFSCNPEHPSLSSAPVLVLLLQVPWPQHVLALAPLPSPRISGNPPGTLTWSTDASSVGSVAVGLRTTAFRRPRLRGRFP